MSTSIIPTKVYKPKEAADLLQVDKSAIYKALNSGELPKKEIGKGFRILGEHLLGFMGSATYPLQQSSQHVSTSNMGAASHDLMSK